MSYGNLVQNSSGGYVIGRLPTSQKPNARPGKERSAAGMLRGGVLAKRGNVSTRPVKERPSAGICYTIGLLNTCIILENSYIRCAIRDISPSRFSFDVGHVGRVLFMGCRYGVLFGLECLRF